MTEQFKGITLLASLVLDDLHDLVKESSPIGPMLAMIYIQPWTLLFPYRR